MTEQDIQEAVEGIMALRPKARVCESNIDHLRAVKRRRDEMTFNKELEAIERDEAIMPMDYNANRLFGLR